MHLDAREAEARHTRLPRTEHVAFPSQLEILLGNAEAVLGFAHDIEPRPGGLSERLLVEEETGGMFGAASDASPQLMKLCQTETLGVFDHHDRRLRYVDA